MQEQLERALDKRLGEIPEGYPRAPGIGRGAGVVTSTVWRSGRIAGWARLSFRIQPRYRYCTPDRLAGKADRLSDCDRERLSAGAAYR